MIAPAGDSNINTASSCLKWGASQWQHDTCQIRLYFTNESRMFDSNTCIIPTPRRRLKLQPKLEEIEKANLPNVLDSARLGRDNSVDSRAFHCHQ
jgi:hypothetical protein